MSKKRKKSHVVTMPQVEDTKIKIKVHPTKVAIGHQPHTTGSGAHQDFRTKRHRTRAAQKRRALREWGY